MEKGTGIMNIQDEIEKWLDGACTFCGKIRRNCPSGGIYSVRYVSAADFALPEPETARRQAECMAAEAIETWIACGMGQVIDTGGKPNYARKPAAGAYDGKALDARPVAE